MGCFQPKMLVLKQRSLFWGKDASIYTPGGLGNAIRSHPACVSVSARAAHAVGSRGLPQFELGRADCPPFPGELPFQPEELTGQDPAGQQGGVENGGCWESNLTAPAEGRGLASGLGEQLRLTQSDVRPHVSGPLQDGGYWRRGFRFCGGCGAEQGESGHHVGRTGPHPGPTVRSRWEMMTSRTCI